MAGRFLKLKAFMGGFGPHAALERFTCITPKKHVFEKAFLPGEKAFLPGEKAFFFGSFVEIFWHLFGLMGPNILNMVETIPIPCAA